MLLATAAPRLALCGTAASVDTLSTLATIKADHARRLLAIAKTLFPHDFIADRYYADAVMYLDQAIAARPPAAEELNGVLTALPDHFADLDNQAREQALAEHSDSAFFKRFRRLTIQAIYGNRDNWQHFGYTGQSLEFGGWVNRDLVDIDWLPDLTT